MSDLKNYHFESAGEFAVVREFVRTTTELLKTKSDLLQAAEQVETRGHFSVEQRRYAKDLLLAAADLVS